MATRIFDRETLLDLVVNAVPLFIMIFFLVGYTLFSPFGFDPLATGLQFGLLLVPIVALSVLTYLSARAIAGDEKRYDVYTPGQATVSGATVLHHGENSEDRTTESGQE